MTHHDKRVWSDTDVARFFGITVSWLRDEAEAGRLPGVKAGKRWLFHPETLEAALLDRAKSAPAKGACDAE